MLSSLCASPCLAPPDQACWRMHGNELGSSPMQVDRLAAEHNIFATRNGRLSMAGVTSSNVGRLAEAMHAVSTENSQARAA